MNDKMKWKRTHQYAFSLGPIMSIASTSRFEIELPFLVRFSCDLSPLTDDGEGEREGGEGEETHLER